MCIICCYCYFCSFLRNISQIFISIFCICIYIYVHMDPSIYIIFIHFSLFLISKLLKMCLDNYLKGYATIVSLLLSCQPLSDFRLPFALLILLNNKKKIIIYGYFIYVHTYTILMLIETHTRVDHKVH